MAFVRFRAPWVRNGTTYSKGAELEVSDDLAEMLVDQRKAVRLPDPAPVEPSDEALLGSVLDEVAEPPPEEPKSPYKAGSVRKPK